MSSEDVIELGSSDDEPEPTPNKKKKPLPNAMVHIPNKLHGVTIRPASVQKNNALKPVPMMKVRNIAPATAAKNKANGKSVLTVMRSNFIQNPVKIQKTSINPLSLMKKLSNSQVMINKIPSSINKVPSSILKHPIKVQGPRFASNFPPITITKVCGNLKRLHNTNVSQVMKKKRKVMKDGTGTILTVNLDDDEVSTSSTSSPQWYLRPEEQQEPNLEETNNKEPAPNNFIEITIEDSPVKPTHIKDTDGDNESVISVNDSPLKTSAQLNTASGETNEKTNTKQSHSKKRLEYPKENEESVSKESIEIEIEPMEVDIPKDNPNEDSRTEQNKDEEVHIVEIMDSPVKKGQHSRLNTQEDSLLKDSNNESNEFSSEYQKFIDLCFQLENSDDMKKIVEKKIKAYYRQAPKEYTESEEFMDMVSSKITAMKTGPEKMYLYIKDIVDELNFQRKMAKSHFSGDKIEENQDAEPVTCGNDGELDAKRNRQIRKLEKTIKKLHRAIQKLEEQEVDFDDEDDSVYLLTERYKERMVRVHAKLCQLTCTKMPSEPRVHIEARPCRPTGPAKRLEKWINKKVPIGTPLPFPDFHDVLCCVREANKEDQLGWNEADIMEEARDLFIRCGKKLQRRRQENEWRLASSRISLDIDPAENSEDLKRKLEQNRQMAAVRETEILNKFAERQNQLKLEPEEIGDKEAEESPSESEDDEINDEDSSLENKFKRKERLKRLIQEKSRINTTISITGDSSNQHKATGDVQETPGDTKIDNDLQKQDLKQEDNMDVDSTKGEVSVASDEKQQKSDINNEQINSISDDSNKLESDIDELHLLNKLYSENEINTSQESTGSVTPLAISDTLDSGSDAERKGKPSGDVISIENSSYSESEMDLKHEQEVNPINECVSDVVDIREEVECTNTSLIKLNTTNNEEYAECVENILLASSCDEESNGPIVENNSESVNLRNDNITISETLVEGGDDDKDNTNNGKKNDKHGLINEDDVKSPDRGFTQNDVPQSVDSTNGNNVQLSCTNDVEESVIDNLVIKEIENANNIELKVNSEEILLGVPDSKRLSEEEELDANKSENVKKVISEQVDTTDTKEEAIQNENNLIPEESTSVVDTDINDSSKEKTTNNNELVNTSDNQQDQTLEQLLEEMMETESNDGLEMI